MFRILFLLLLFPSVSSSQIDSQKLEALKISIEKKKKELQQYQDSFRKMQAGTKREGTAKLQTPNSKPLVPSRETETERDSGRERGEGRGWMIPVVAVIMSIILLFLVRKRKKNSG